MKVRFELSAAPNPTVQLAVAIVNYIRTPDEAIDLAKRLWPNLTVYRGHFHLRLMPNMKSGEESIYVEFD